MPDPLLRIGIRKLLTDKLRAEGKDGETAARERLKSFVAELKKSPIAINTADANAQHYELPTEFFKIVLGPYLKYSSGYWNAGVSDLGRSEKDMLALTVERAELADGQDILELGCGWGSLTLYMAERFKESSITAVSNSRTQAEYILSEAARRGLANVSVVTADMNQFSVSWHFHRVVSVEMFEHMRNYQELLRRISHWLAPGGKCFVHIFAHRCYVYPYVETDETDWIAKYFFTGGLMPSEDIFSYFKEDLSIEKQWRVSGTHYQKTCEAWLRRMDAHPQEVMSILLDVYGDEAQKWRVYWRVFFMACAELFGYKGGSEWAVSHYLFRKNEHNP